MRDVIYNNIYRGLMLLGALTVAGTVGTGLYRVTKGESVNTDTFIFPAYAAVSIGTALYMVGSDKHESLRRKNLG